MSAAAIAANGLGKRFGRAAALTDVSFELAPGRTLAVLGANGAGKSTLLRLLAGLARPTRGELRVAGRPPTDRQGRGRVGYVGHATLLYPALTARENLLFAAHLHGLADREGRAGAALEREGLAPVADRPAGGFSRGMAQRLAIARGLLHDPPVVLLDEPFTGLDAVSADRLEERLGALREEGRTVVWVTHDATRAARGSDQAPGAGPWPRGGAPRGRRAGHRLADARPRRTAGGAGMNVLWAVLWKDLVTEWRGRDRAVAMLLFAMLVVVVFHFALPGGTGQRTQELAPGLLWVTWVFAAVLGLNRAFSLELENDALTGLALVPRDRGWVFLGKAAANFVILGVVQALSAVVFAIVFGLDLGGQGPAAGRHRRPGQPGPLLGRHALRRHRGPHPLPGGHAAPAALAAARSGALGLGPGHPGAVAAGQRLLRAAPAAGGRRRDLRDRVLRRLRVRARRVSEPDKSGRFLALWARFTRFRGPCG